MRNNASHSILFVYCINIMNQIKILTKGKYVMTIESVLPVMTDGNTLLVTSQFGYRPDPFTGVYGGHKGIDLTCWKGWSALSGISAAWDGTVTTVYDNVEGFSSYESRGNYVIIDHGNGVQTQYLHMLHGSITVNVGDYVTAGQKIGYMGSTGYSTGAHLHFQLEIHGEPVDPYPYLIGEVELEDECVEDIPVTEETPPIEDNFVSTEESVDTGEMDNTPCDWSADAVQWATENGIMYGDQYGNLHLRDKCTREQVITFLYRALFGGGS